jgi:cytochrome P450
VGYGYTVEPTKQDPLTTLNEDMINAFSIAATPMTWLPDIFPVLSRLPRNLPLPFLKAARRLRHNVDTAVFTPYRFVREQMAKGTERPSFVSNLIRKHLQNPEDLSSLSPGDESDIIFTAVSLYAGGGDAVAISLTVFTMAMAIYPEVQKKAQAEIDAVTGGDRLPTFEDRQRLPYLNALIKELSRWWPVSTLGVPHLADEDIEYEGYLIPKGAYILPGVWWMLHNPDAYPEPEVFEPARFLPPRNEADATQDAFGYGRRACPGRMFAEANLFSVIAHTLAVFDIRKALDADGKEIDIEPKYRQGVLGYAEPFEVRVTPRSERHAELVRRFERENPLEQGDSVSLKMVWS